MASCKSCGAELRWALTMNGKPIPLDPEPSINGNLELVGGTARYVTPDHNATTARYVSHYATCPNAKQHRKP